MKKTIKITTKSGREYKNFQTIPPTGAKGFDKALSDMKAQAEYEAHCLL